MPLIRRLWPTLLASFRRHLRRDRAGPRPADAGSRRAGAQGAGRRADPLRHSRRLAHPPAGAGARPRLGSARMGAANGAVSTATGVFMFPVIPYIQSLGLERDDLVQAQGISFTVSTFALTFVVLGNGTLNATNAAGVVGRHGGHIRRHVPRPIRPQVHPSRGVPLPVLHRDAGARRPPRLHPLFSCQLRHGLHRAGIVAELRIDRHRQRRHGRAASVPRPCARTARARRNADRATPPPASP